MRAMNRYKLFDDERIKLESYFTEIFTKAECAELVGLQDYDSYRGAAVLADRAASMQWLENFMAQERLPRQLEYDSRCDGDRLEHMQIDPAEVHRAAQTLVKNLMARPEPVPLKDAPNLLPNANRKVLARAMHEAIRHAVVFPALRIGDLEPVLGILPAIARRLNRVPPPKPEPLAAHARQCVDIPFRMEDITALLVACSKEPLRLRAGSGELFSKACEDIYAGMVQLPAWYSKFAGFTPDDDVDCIVVPPRIERAFDLALDLDLTRRDRNADGKGALTVTPLGMAWLFKDPKERLKNLLDFVHIHAKRVQRKSRGTPDFLSAPEESYRRSDTDYFTRQFIWGDTIGRYWPYNWRHEAHETKIKQAIAGAFGELAVDSYYALDKFLVFNSESVNPLPELLRESPNRETPRFSYAGFNFNEDVMERIWADTLLKIFWRALGPFAGVSVAANADGHTPEFAMTSAGRYLMGLADDFELESAVPGTPADVLVVQPNFEVVFLAPSPGLEAACARFCERAGKGRNIGILFNITRKSIHAAAGTGLTAEEVIGTLSKAASRASGTKRELPRNVEHEINAWFAQCRHVAVRHATLIECPDAETAAKVARGWSGKSVLIGSTIVELSSAVKKTEIARKLRAMGVFVRSAETRTE